MKQNIKKHIHCHTRAGEYPEGNKASLIPGCPTKSGMTESGRSMVEMLGVLAIIGVISIGAIGGYTYGMNRYRTNEILDGANKRAYTISTQDSLGIPYNLSEYRDYNVTAGGIFGDTNTIQDWDGEFGLTITGVSKDVCENLIRMMGDKSTLRAITKTSDEKTDLAPGDCASPTNDLYLVYNKDMAADDSTNSGRSGGGGYCATHDCGTTTCGSGANAFACGSNDQRMDYDNAEAYCAEQGGTMVTASDLGCTAFGQVCTNGNTPSGGYWIVNDIGVNVGSNNALVVYNSTLVSDSRDAYTRSGDGPVPLCK